MYSSITDANVDPLSSVFSRPLLWLFGKDVFFFSLSLGVGVGGVFVVGIGVGVGTSGGKGVRVVCVNNLVSIVCIWRAVWYCMYITINAVRVITIKQVTRI